MPLTHQDERLLKALAVANVDRPRATLKELAEAAGVSKATLHRFCGTRENLVEMLMDYCEQVLNQVIANCGLEDDEPLEGLQQLINEHLAHREMLVFLIFQYRPDSLDPEVDPRWGPYNDALDAFFLRAQRLGILRIDVPAAVLTELFLSIIFAMVDAERRGRAARANTVTIIEQMFLRGAAA